MKGLLTKEFYINRQGIGLMYVLLILLFSVMSALLGPQDTQWFIATYPGILVGMLPINLMFVEENEKWEQYAPTLPVSRGQLVSTKYLVVLLISLIYAAAVILSQAAAMTIRHSFDGPVLLSFISKAIYTSLIISSISLPPMFALGAAKGRWIASILGGISTLVILLPQIFLEGEGGAATAHSIILPGALIAVSLLLFAGSWLLSIFLYKRRDL